MLLTKNPNLLLSLVNTDLRDKYSSLEDYCYENEVSIKEVSEILSSIGYFYDPETNQFKTNGD